MQPITHSELQALVRRLPADKLSTAFNLLVDLADDKTDIPPHQTPENRQKRPTMPELLAKLREIQKTELAEIELPVRTDRPVGLTEMTNELSL